MQDNVRPINLETEIQRSFISYAMAVIVSRALPDVRDGLKPVHRRLLFSMNELGTTPDKPFRKAVRIVGDVLGKYHPHGDSAVYDTMVRLAQDFTMRYPLVDGQGNFGSVDGDEAAAMRYTEARLSPIAMQMVEDIEKETVDFYPNFDESRLQPDVLPARFPNLLVNGASGIAVGMATNIPPHNLGEVIDAVKYLIDNPECTIEELMRLIPGPDFPTGGTIMGTSGIHAAYRTGRGKIVTRAKSEIEQLANGKSQIVVTEIPYLVNKARLVEKIAELVKEKRVEGITDLRDESDRNGMRIVIELRKDINPQVLLNTLYKHTQLQESFGVIMLALVNAEPKILNLKECLVHYVNHQRDVITRRTRYELERAQARAHILEGLIIALDHIDEIVQLIRSSASTADAKNGLMERFGMSEKQAQAVLDMRLARLTALERNKIEEELNGLRIQIEDYKDILAKPERVDGIIKDEITIVRDKFADKRRTDITPLEGEIDIEDLIDEETVVITMSDRGYVKRTGLDTYRAQRRGGKGITGASAREEDFICRMTVTSTHSDLLFFTNRGRVFKLKGYQIPEAGRTARGTAIVNLLQLDGEETVTTVLSFQPDQHDGSLIMATKYGVIKRTSLEEFKNIRNSGLIAIGLREGDELIGVAQSEQGDCDVLIGTRQGLCIRFAETDVTVIGRSGQGVKSMELADDDEIVDMALLHPEDETTKMVLTIAQNGYGKRTDLSDYRCQTRGGKGKKAFAMTEKTGLLAAQKVVSDEDDIILITEEGVLIRMHASEVSQVGRVSQGVRLMRVDSKIASVVTVPREEEDETEE